MNQSVKNLGGIYGDAFVYFKDGRQIKIKDVVREEQKGEILTFNEQTDAFEYRKITEWHHVGTVKNNDDLLNIKAEGLGAYDGTKNGITSITLIPKHKILTTRGWVESDQLSSSDFLVTSYKSIQGQMRDVLYAMTAGDCHILSDSNNSKNTAALNFQDSENVEYLNWKINKLSPVIKFHTSSRSFVSDYRHDFKVIEDEISAFESVNEELGRNPIYFLERHFTPLGLAIYIMDDGSFNNGRYSLSIARFAVYRPVLRIVSEVFKTYGYENKLYIDTINHQADLKFNKEASRKIAETIYRYIPACMQYKLPEEFQNKYEEFDIDFRKELLPESVRFISKANASNRQLNKLKAIYNLEIEGSNNFMVGNHANGFIVKAGM